MLILIKTAFYDCLFFYSWGQQHWTMSHDIILGSADKSNLVLKFFRKITAAVWPLVRCARLVSDEGLKTKKAKGKAAAAVF